MGTEDEIPQNKKTKEIVYKIDVKEMGKDCQEPSRQARNVKVKVNPDIV